jgi:hypothetical protein
LKRTRPELKTRAETTICRQCPNRARPGLKTCADCAARAAKKARERARQCLFCSLPARRNQKMCAACATRNEHIKRAREMPTPLRMFLNRL